MKNRNVTFYYLFVFVFSILALSGSIHKVLDPDEIEHIHSAWYIQNGHIPYRDFFENHHPLLWFILGPFMTLFGYGVTTVILIRLLNLIFFYGIVFLVYKITKTAAQSSEAGLSAVVMLLSMVIFVEKGIEIRPDVPQVFFGFGSLYYLLAFFRERKNKYIFYSGLWASVSFLFLQKALFLIIIYACIFILKFVQSRISLASLVIFTLSFTTPLLFFLLYLILTESLNDYVVNNWMFHISHLKSFSALLGFWTTIRNNTVFWIVSIPSVLFISTERHNREMKLILSIGLFLLLSVFMVKHPFSQYFMFPTAILCIGVGYFLNKMFIRHQLSVKQKMLVLILMTIIPFTVLCRFTFVTTNHQQLEKISFVLDNSRESDLVYDGAATFNVFRKDLHYFWFSLSSGWGLDSYNRITHNRFIDYNTVKLIKEKQPRIISDYRLNIEKCGLSKQYKKTRYTDLYIRSQ